MKCVYPRAALPGIDSTKISASVPVTIAAAIVSIMMAAPVYAQNSQPGQTTDAVVPNDSQAVENTENIRILNSNTFYDRGVTAVEEGDDRAAVIEFHNAIKEDTKNLSAYIKMAEALLRMKDPAMAEVTLNTALDQGASRQFILVLMAQSFLDQGKYNQLLEDITSAGLPQSAKLRIKVARARAYMSLRKLDQAEKNLKEVLALSPKDVNAVFELCRVYLSRNQHSLVEPALEQLPRAKIYPDYWSIRAEAKRAGGHFDKALTLYSEALLRDPDQLESLQARASIYLDKRMLDAANVDIQRLRVAYPKDLRGLILEATWALKSVKPKIHQQALNEAAELIANIEKHKLANDPYHLILVGTARYMRSEFSQASGFFRQSLVYDPLNTAASILLARSYMQLGQGDRAVELLEPVLLRRPKNGEVAALLAEAYFAIADYTKAREHFDKAIDLNKDNQIIEGELSQRLAMTTFATGDIDAAVAEMRAYLDKDWEEGQASLTAAYKLAEMFVRSQRYEDAISFIDRQLKATPANHIYLHIKGTALLGTGDIAAGKSHFLRALNLNPEFIPSLLNLARLDINQAQWVPARNYLDKVLAIDFRNRAALKMLSRIEHETGNLQASILMLEKAMELELEIGPGITLVNLLYNQNRVVAATDYVEKLASQFPESLLAQTVKAELSLKSNNAERARRTYRHMALMAQEQQSVSWLLKIAKDQLTMDEIKAAFRTLNMAKSISSDRLNIKITEAEFKLYMGQYVEALNMAEDIITLATSQPVGYLLAGAAASRSGDIGVAKQWYRKGINSAKGSSQLAIAYYQVLAKSGELNTAVTGLESWLVNNKHSNLQALKVLAAGHAELGNIDKAIDLNEQLLKLSPKDVFVINNLAVLYHESGDSRARVIAEKAHKLAPDHWGILDTLGWILVNDNDLALGLSMLRNALTMSANNAEVRYHYAVALEKSGKKSAARRELKQALEQNASFKGSQQARQMLVRLAEKRGTRE